MIPRRKARLSALYHKVVSFFLERELSLAGAFVTVTKVEVTDNLEQLTVYVSIWPDEKEGEVLRELGRLRRKLRLHLAEKVKAKFAPQIEFALDESEKKRIAFEELLKKTR